MARHEIVRLGDLGRGLTLLPERHLATRLLSLEGALLGDFATERGERISPRDLLRATVLDTTHSRDGLIDVRGAMRTTNAPSSAKKRVRVGDLLVSRLRPYLRQIALVHPRSIEELGERVVGCSSEYYVLRPHSSDAKDDIAFLLPFLLSQPVQDFLAASQEGGHHPRVARDALFSIRVPRSLVRDRKPMSARVNDALRAVYDAGHAFDQAMAIDQEAKPSSAKKSASGKTRSPRS